MTHLSAGVEMERYGAHCGIDLERTVGDGQVMECRVILQRFAYREERVVGRSLRYVRETHWHAVSRHRFAEPVDCSRFAAQQPRGAKKKIRLALSVRANEPNAFSARTLRVRAADVVPRQCPAVRPCPEYLGESVDDQRRCHDLLCSE